MHQAFVTMTTTAIRTRLYDYIRIADDKKLHAIYNLLEPQIEATYEWWNDKELLADLDEQCRRLESGEDKGATLDELAASIKKLKQDKYGK